MNEERRPDTVADVVAEREIEEILHFTTNRGLTGILATKALKSRDLLREDQYLEKLFTPNANIRRDEEWTDHVNLSISRINTQFFAKSHEWHAVEDLWWAVLSFEAVILEHDDVTFATTNNIYSGVRRGRGVEGVEALFADRVHQYLGNYQTRYPGMPPSTPTCPQAEVLYPQQLSTEFLQTIYVAQPIHAQTVEAMMSGLQHPVVQVEVAPAVFGW